MIKIIAELAQGFEGKPEQAQLLVLAGARAGADAVKMQLVYAEELCTPDYKDFKLFETLEMSDQVWHALAASAKKLNVELHLDVFGPRSLALAESLGAQAIKIHGTDMGNIGLLRVVAKSGIKQVLLGAGGAYLPEINQAVELMAEKQAVILLGFQGYPTPNVANQIDRVRAVAKAFSNRPNVMIGFADHAPPNSPLSLALAAMALGAGAKIFEKHLTLAQTMKLEDHEAALNPDQFSEFAAGLRACEEALGNTTSSPDFGMSDSELGYRQWTRKHVVASRPIKAGTTIKPEAVVLKRTPSTEILTDLDSAYGKQVLRDIAVNQPISPSDIGEGKGQP
jgi:N,N'-diacetyllegionaminate synthase